MQGDGCDTRTCGAPAPSLGLLDSGLNDCTETWHVTQKSPQSRAWSYPGMGGSYPQRSGETPFLSQGALERAVTDLGWEMAEKPRKRAEAWLTGTTQIIWRHGMCPVPSTLLLWQFSTTDCDRIISNLSSKTIMGVRTPGTNYFKLTCSALGPLF